MGCLKLTYDQGEGVEANASSIFWQVYKKGGSGSKSCVEYYRYGFQGEYSEEDSETGWNSFELRMYDPVIGRWNVTDPYYEYWSPYVGMGNNSINYVDPDGGCVGCLPLAASLYGTDPALKAWTGGAMILQEVFIYGGLNLDEDGFSQLANITKDHIAGLEEGRPSMSEVEALIIHRTVSTNYPGPWMKSRSRVKGAHFYIDTDGTVFQTGSVNISIAHIYNNSKQMYSDFYGKLINTNTIGIEVVGNYKNGKWDGLTPKQVGATAQLIEQVMNHYNLNKNQVYPHEKIQRKTEGEGQTVLDAIGFD
ncbi:MAG: N-acetylmuramoyl-L-alanine amidase [Bacteroidota bacterium]